MIFDTHAHYDADQFDADRDALLRSMAAQGVGKIVNVSAAVKSWEDTLRLTQEYPFMYGAVGVHPDEVGDLDEENFARMKTFFPEKKIVAVGEIGLDYYWDRENHLTQKKWFVRQLMLARELGLPVIIHSRDAAEDTINVLKEHGQGMKAVVHCYSYSPEMALEYEKMGYLIGVGGVVTFKNGKKLKKTVEAIDIEHILLETDCPYLSPEPNRGKRNSSLNLSYVAEEIGRIKGLSTDEVIRITEKNAEKFYGLEG